MAFWSATATPSSPTTAATTMSLSSFSTPSISFRTCNKLNRTNTRNGFPISCCSNSATSSSSSVSEASIMATTMINPPVIKKRKRYRKEYPGESVGITEEMRFVAMRLRNIKGKYINKTGNDPIDFDEEYGEKSDGVDEASSSSSSGGEDGDDDGGDGGGTWEPSIQGFVKYLVDSKLVFDTVERIVDESGDVSYAYFRKNGLERSEGLLKDLEWFSMQDVEIPEPSNAGVSYVKYLEELAEKSAPLFLSHFYNIYFSHIAGGQVIAKQVSKTLLEGRELEFYSWEGDVQELLKDVRDKVNMLGEHWPRDAKNKCLRETTKSFRFMGQIVRLIIL